MTRGKWLLVLIGVYVLILILFSFYTPKKVNWHASFSEQHSWPYGTKVLYEKMPNLCPDQAFVLNDKTMYECFKEMNFDSSSRKLFMLINEDMYIDDLDIESLDSFVQAGNYAFISARYFSYDILRGFDVQDSSFVELTTDWQQLNLDSFNLSIANDDQQYQFLLSSYQSYFTPNCDSTFRAYSLGYCRDSTIVNFIEVPYGNGSYYLHSNPFSFTNYHILYGDGYDYTKSVLASLPIVDTIIWDSHYKDGNVFLESSTPLQEVFKFSNFKWAYWLTLLAILLFMVFHSKRRERAIPIIDPPKNRSIEFAKTMGNLYYQQRNNKDLLDKKIRHLKDILSINYHMKDVSFNESDVQKLKEKTNVDQTKLQALFKDIQSLSVQSKISDVELKRANDAINYFYKNV